MLFDEGCSTGLFLFSVWFDAQNGDVCKDCTQIFELLADLLSNTDLQVGSHKHKHTPAHSCLFTDKIMKAVNVSVSRQQSSCGYLHHRGSLVL